MRTPFAPAMRAVAVRPEVISYALWLYFAFPLSLHTVEEMLAAFGQAFANQIPRRRGRLRAGAGVAAFLFLLPARADQGDSARSTVPCITRLRTRPHALSPGQPLSRS